MSITVTGLSELISDFRAAPAKLETQAKRNVSKTALEIKKGAQSRVQASLSARSHLPHYSRSIDYDLLDDGLTAEVGPNPDKIQGAFGPGVEFGSARTAPISHLYPSGDEQWPKYVQGISGALDAAP